MNKLEYQELIAFHPGYYVKDYIDEQGITQEELAKRLQTTPKYISDLVNGRINLTDEMVLKLSIVFGTSTKLWLNLNQKFIEKKLEIEKRIRIDQECELAKNLIISFGLSWAWLRQQELQQKKYRNFKDILKYLRLVYLVKGIFLFSTERAFLK